MCRPVKYECPLCNRQWDDPHFASFRPGQTKPPCVYQKCTKAWEKRHLCWGAKKQPPVVDKWTLSMSYPCGNCQWGLDHTRPQTPVTNHDHIQVLPSSSAPTQDPPQSRPHQQNSLSDYAPAPVSLWEYVLADCSVILPHDQPNPEADEAPEPSSEEDQASNQSSNEDNISDESSATDPFSEGGAATDLISKANSTEDNHQEPLLMADHMSWPQLAANHVTTSSSGAPPATTVQSVTVPVQGPAVMSYRDALMNALVADNTSSTAEEVNR